MAGELVLLDIRIIADTVAPEGGGQFEVNSIDGGQHADHHYLVAALFRELGILAHSYEDP